VLGIFGDNYTTDHASPGGEIPPDSPAGQYLQSIGVASHAFNSYVGRRGNHHVMARAAYSNLRSGNRMVDGREGWWTRCQPEDEEVSIFEAASRYGQRGIPLVVMAGREFGTGSSRDWAAKGPALLGVRAVIARSFERIHRSNLIGMGVLPLCFEEGMSWQTLGLRGDEQVTIRGLQGEIKPRQRMIAEIVAADGGLRRIPLICRIDTLDELDYFKHGGILHYVLRHLVAA